MSQYKNDLIIEMECKLLGQDTDIKSENINFN